MMKKDANGEAPSYTCDSSHFAVLIIVQAMMSLLSPLDSQTSRRSLRSSTRNLRGVGASCWCIVKETICTQPRLFEWVNFDIYKH